MATRRPADPAARRPADAPARRAADAPARRGAGPQGAAPAAARAPRQAATGSASAGQVAELATVLAEVLKVRTVAPDSHFFDDLGADSMSMARFCARLRKRPELPAVSIRDVYRHPTISALVTALAPAKATARPAAKGAAAGMAAVLADVLKIDIVPVDSHFFDDLGADSMSMAQFCAKLRKRPELPTVSIKDVYRHTTITALAAAFGGAATPAARKDSPHGQPGARLPGSVHHAHVPQQAALLPLRFPAVLWILAFPLLMTFVTANGFVWVSTSATLQDLYLRALTFSGIAFVGMCLAPVLLKWLLVGRLKPRQFRVWSLTYFRFWLVKIAGPGQPARPVQRQPDLLDLPADARREDRPRRGHLLADRPGVHRPAHRSGRAR